MSQCFERIVWKAPANLSSHVLKAAMLRMFDRSMVLTTYKELCWRAFDTCFLTYGVLAINVQGRFWGSWWEIATFF